MDFANDNARNLLLRNRNGKLEESGIEAGVAYNEDGRAISGMGADFADDGYAVFSGAVIADPDSPTFGGINDKTGQRVMQVGGQFFF